MSLRVAVAAPFKRRGTHRIRENEFVVALSLERDWFTPDQSKRLVDIATAEKLLEREDADLLVTFDPSTVEIPEGFVPGEDLLCERSAFERVLDTLVSEGLEKHEAVGAINSLQGELGVTIETAAVIYARRQGVDVSELVPVARSALLEDEDD